MRSTLTATNTPRHHTPANGLDLGPDCITSADYAELMRLGRHYAELLGGDADALTQDAARYLARALGEASQHWTALAYNADGSVQHWLDETGDVVVISRSTLLRAALDEAAAGQGLWLDDLAEQHPPRQLTPAA